MLVEFGTSWGHTTSDTMQKASAKIATETFGVLHFTGKFSLYSDSNKVPRLKQRGSVYMEPDVLESNI